MFSPGTRLNVGDEGQAVGEGDGGDEQIVRPDDLAASLERIADLGVAVSRSIVERQRTERAECLLDPCHALVTFFVLPCSVQKFGPHHRAHGDFLSGRPTQARCNRRVGVFQ